MLSQTDGLETEPENPEESLRSLKRQLLIMERKHIDMVLYAIFNKVVLPILLSLWEPFKYLRACLGLKTRSGFICLLFTTFPRLGEGCRWDCRFPRSFREP